MKTSTKKCPSAICGDVERPSGSNTQTQLQLPSDEPTSIIDNLYAWLGKRFRAKHKEAFLRCFMPSRELSILDVGGYPLQWENIGCDAAVTILNRQTLESFEPGDGTQLEYTNNEFDIVFSDSAVEHLGTVDRQQAFAREVRRVGRRLWIQTAARSFFVQPDLPKPIARRLRDNAYKQLSQRRRDRDENLLGKVRLLSFTEMKELFPDCYIHRETFMGVTKSFVAIRN